MKRLVEWLASWVETWRVAPPFSARRRRLIERAREPFDPADYVEIERPGHEAEAWRRGYEPRVEFGWHCLTCGAEGSAFSATVAESRAAAHAAGGTP